MKVKTILTLVLLTLVVLPAATLLAQSGPQLLLKVDVPFRFYAGGMELLAGQYDVFHVTNANWILIRSSDQRAAAIVKISVGDMGLDQLASKLVFNRYGDKYFLSEVWTAQDYQIHRCTPSNIERNVALNSVPETVDAAFQP